MKSEYLTLPMTVGLFLRVLGHALLRSEEVGWGGRVGVGGGVPLNKS